MPKLSRRKRIYTPNKNRVKLDYEKSDDPKYNEVDTARGRLKGALMEVLEPPPPPPDVESDESSDVNPAKGENRKSSVEEFLTDEEAKKCIRKSPVKQSYVLKLFDRSVDLSQFREDSPLYPICRAWITNQPKANYKECVTRKKPEPEEDSVELPGPEGPPISRIPELLKEQRDASKDNIKLDYQDEEPLPSKEQLLRAHAARWAAVRQTWLDHSIRVESRYEATQKVLNRINIEYLNNR